MMADFLNSSEKRLCILILISVKYFKKVRIKIPKLRPYFTPLRNKDSFINSKNENFFRTAKQESKAQVDDSYTDNEALPFPPFRTTEKK